MNSGPQNKGSGGSKMKWEKGDKKFRVGYLQKSSQESGH